MRRCLRAGTLVGSWFSRGTQCSRTLYSASDARKIRRKNSAAIKMTLSDQERKWTFADAGLSHSLCQQLQERFDIDKPIGVQLSAIKSILDGENCVVAAQCGTGKTVQYDHVFFC